MSTLRLEILGPLRVTGDGLVEPSRPSHRRLLSLLTLEAGHRIGTERLIDMHWGEAPPPEAKASLQTHISALRRLLRPDLIKTEGYGYRLALDGLHLDSIEFDGAARDSRRAHAASDWESVVEAASRALALWRGSPFPDLRDDDFARPEITRLEETHAELWEMWGESMLQLGRPTEALPELERLVILHPYRERLWEHLMTARYRLGRHAEALRAFRELNDLLAEMGLEPGPGIRRLETKILLHHEELSTPPHNLPAEPTSFVGRETELTDIVELLAAHRLVTLTGVGGSGKTRLATHAARDRLASSPDGSWFVNLADLEDPELIPLEVVAVLGFKPSGEDPLEDLAASIRHDAVLFVVDNCEHLRSEAAVVVQRLIDIGERVKVLATSREPLHLPAEVVYEVPPLAVPAPDLPTVETSAYDAVRLFVDRAALVDPRFTPDDEAYSVIGSICRRLDGIPLAIELTAAKIRSFSLDLIDERLGDRFRLLTESSVVAIPRHKSLDAAIGWSYDLLNETERRLLACLSVFRGGFDLDMVQSIAPDHSGPADGFVRAFEGLIDKSLVARERTAVGRYRLLEPVREFAQTRLGESGEEAQARSRHLDWCVGFAGELENRIYGTGRHELLTRLAVEIENLHAGLEWAVEQSDSHALSLIASATAWHWWTLGSNSRSREALLVSLSHAGEDGLREGDLRSRLASSTWLLGHGEEALREAILARDVVRDLEASPRKAVVLGRLASMYRLLIDQDPRQAIALAREAVVVAEASGDRVTLVRSRIYLGDALSWAGEVEEGLEVHRNALADALEVGDPSIALDVYNALFNALYLHPDERRDGGRRLVDDLLPRFSQDEWAREIAPGWLPYIFLQSGEWDQAEDSIRRHREGRKLEGYHRDTHLMTLGTLCWMRGDLDGASAAMTELKKGGINPRWYHDFYPLLTDIAADAGDLDAARRHVEAYLTVTVDPSEEAKKLGALHPLVRAEVNAALDSTGDERIEHMTRAGAAVEKMGTILEEFPPPTEGSLSMETHRTHLAFARAELSRATGGQTDLWEEAADRADFLYFRLYARFRLSEAMAEAGDTEGASRLLRQVHDEASKVGAVGLERLIARAASGLS